MKIGTWIAVILVVVGALILIAKEVSAQTSGCAQREQIVERLQSKYGETRQRMGLDNSNRIVEVFASDETGTWTILVTSPSGMSCLLAHGQSWTEFEPEIKPEGTAL